MSWDMETTSCIGQYCAPILAHIQAHIDAAAEDLTRAIQEALAQTVPRFKRSSQMRPGWNAECADIIRRVRSAERRYKSTGDREDREDWKALENQKKRTLRQAMTDEHRERVSKTDTIEGLWKLNKWIRNRGTQMIVFMPGIRNGQGTIEDDNEAKAKALPARLFPEPAAADLSDIPTEPTPFPRPLPFPSITEREIQEAIKAPASN